MCFVANRFKANVPLQFDSLVQTATGFNQDEGEAYAAFLRSENSEQGDEGTTSEVGSEPQPFPFQAIDHAAGHLLAYGINAALCRTITASQHRLLVWYFILTICF